MTQEERARENGNTDAFTREEDRNAGMTKRELMATIIMAGSAPSLNNQSANYLEERQNVAAIALHAADDLLLALEQVV